MAYALATKDWTLAPFERDEIAKHREKIMTAGNFAGGGSLIPPQYIAELIEILRAQLITARLGVRMMTGLVGAPVLIPRLTGTTAANWIAPEGTTITASDQATGRVEMTPKKVASLVKLSNDLVTLGNPSVEAGVRADIIRSLQEAIDKAVFQGTGVSGQPTGLLNVTPALTTQAFTNTDAKTAHESLTSALKTLENNESLADNIKWAMSPTSYWKLASYTDATIGRPALMQQQVATFGGPVLQTLEGYPVFRSTLVSPAGTNDAYVGNWDDVMLGIWSQVEVVGSMEADTAFAADELWIRAIARVDVAVRREKSFIRVTSVG
jgi:HK97 family phage major capsid protein